MTRHEAAAFRDYLLKGGFFIVDDFSERRGGWDNFEAQMHRILPEARFLDVDDSDPIFHSFFEIDSLDDRPHRCTTIGPSRSSAASTRTTIRSKRLIVLINYNTRYLGVLGMVGHRPRSRWTKRTKPTSSASTTSSTG